ncbi:protein of unknown function [Burkholderia multivorans]
MENERIRRTGNTGLGAVHYSKSTWPLDVVDPLTGKATRSQYEQYLACRSRSFFDPYRDKGRWSG